MGYRLSKIYTKSGDDGTTGLGDNTRVVKHHPRVVAYGTVDELNAALGLILAERLPGTIRTIINRLQHELFSLGGELCLPGAAAPRDLKELKTYQLAIDEAKVSALEQDLDALNAQLPPLKEFILPSGSLTISLCHLARTICRRAERHVCALNDLEPLNPSLIRYLNRLSDLLFVIARFVAKALGTEEVYWRSLKVQKAEREPKTLETAALDEAAPTTKLRQILTLGALVPVLTFDSVTTGVAVAEALFQGGLRVLEITLRTKIAFKVVEAIRKALPEMFIGVGSVIDSSDMQLASEVYGVDFVVSPGLSRPLLATAERLRISYLPGVATLSEALLAREWGYKILKFFPARELGGVATLKAWSGPVADLQFCPTGGITELTAPEFLALPQVLCVGGSWCAPVELCKQKKWPELTKLAARAVSLKSKPV